MASELEIVAKVFGTKELVAGLDQFGKQLRMRFYGAMKTLARAYAEDVVVSGLAEQGIRSRTGNLRQSMVVRGRMSNAGISVLVYPGAKDPRRGYRYPWALGKGSPKNEIDVRAHFRRVPGGAKRPTARALNSRRSKLYSAKQSQSLSAAGAVQVAQHPRKINMKPRPFMSGGALTRLNSQFAAKMQAAIEAAVQDAQRVATASATEFDGMGIG